MASPENAPASSPSGRARGGINWGEFKYVAPGWAEGTHNILFYLPGQDADRDGLPDPGAAPVGEVQLQTIDVRLGQH